MTHAESGIPCTWMRGGTSKGAYFLASDLPEDESQRDALLLSIMGSPDERQIDGIGGADPLTSKVAVVSPSTREDADIEYLFLQVFVDQPLVSDAQNCGNLLAGVGQFAVEKKLVDATTARTEIRVYMQNSQQLATVTIDTLQGQPVYSGGTSIDGVPGTAAPVLQNFPDAAGSACGSLLPSGNRQDSVAGVNVTLIDNGMPVVILAAADFDDCGITGYESRAELDANDALKKRLETIRLQAGELMNLGDVKEKTVPKMTLVAAPENGSITTRTFIPHRCHASIGVLGAVSVATACVLEGSVAHAIARTPQSAGNAGNKADSAAANDDGMRISVEHPLGETSVVMDVTDQGGKIDVKRAAVVRTARKLFDGRVFAL